MENNEKLSNKSNNELDINYEFNELNNVNSQIITEELKNNDEVVLNGKL